MRKIMYDLALFVLHKKRQTLAFSRRHKKKLLIHTQNKMIPFFRKG